MLSNGVPKGLVLIDMLSRRPNPCCEVALPLSCSDLTVVDRNNDPNQRGFFCGSLALFLWPLGAFGVRLERLESFLFVLGPFCNLLGPSCALFGFLGVLKWSWGILGRSWAVLGPSWGILGRSWAVLGALGAVLGRSWGVLGRSWAALGATFGGPKSIQKSIRKPTRNRAGSGSAKIALELRLYWFQSLIGRSGNRKQPDSKVIETVSDVMTSYIYIYVCISYHPCM